MVPYPFDTAPSQRLKFEQYYTALEKSGYTLTCDPFIDQRFWKIIYQQGRYLQKLRYTMLAYLRRFFLLWKVGQYDIVYVHLWATPFGPALYERLLRLLAKKIIYDIDDLIYKGGSSPNNRMISFLKTSWKVDYLMRRADHVLVSTPKLLAYTRQFTHHVSVIPATIDVNKYQEKALSTAGPVVIGWSGSHTTSRYLHLLDRVFKELAGRHSIKIKVMGDQDFVIDGLDIELLAWSAEQEVAHLMDFDIGVHPLPDEEWVYGKSGGKLVQYMAVGIPIVASAIGPNFIAIKDGYNGFLVSTEDEWLLKLELLITDEKLRRAMGNNAKTLARENYSVEANLDKYLQVFKPE